MKHLTIIPLLGIMVACQSPAPISYEVMPVSAKPEMPITGNGSYYALPRQKVEINVLVKKQEFIKGQYAEFADKFLGLKTVIKDNYSNYSIENVDIKQKSELDPKQVYFVLFNDAELAVEYDKNMIISSVNMFDTPLKKRQKAARKQTTYSGTKHSNNGMVVPTINFFERTDTMISKQLVDTQTIQRYEIRTVKAEKTMQQKAEEIVDQIIKIREDRTKLLTGFQEVNYEAKAIEFMVSEFNRMEDEYIKLFTGSSKTSFETFHFEYLPEHKDSLNIVLGKFSSTEGLLPSSNPNDGQKIILDIALNETVPNAIQKFSKNINLSKKGFYYVIPSQALAKIKIGNQTITERQVIFSQFGCTQSLAPKLMQIEFSPKTGEILKLKALETDDND